MRNTLIASLLIAFFVAAPAAHAQVEFAWVQYGAGGLEARVATRAGQCPELMADGEAKPMQRRAAASEAYAITSCSLALSETARDVSVEGRKLPMPVAAPKRILLIGDTGCRLKGQFVQSCNDPKLWPFAPLAGLAAAMHPDLILHVGDYHYRETACPPGETGCAGTPFGDNWPVWKADFFQPAEPLLSAAPWIMVRGNHEDCQRGGKGWSRMLDPYAFPADGKGEFCHEQQKPYAVALGDLTIAVMDVIIAEEANVNEAQATAYREQFRALSDLAPAGPIWLAMHRPIWSADLFTGPDLISGDNKTLAAAARDALPARLQMMISGHEHKFEVDGYGRDLPMQIVAGHTGDMLSPHPPKDPVGMMINGVTISEGIARPNEFGFAMLEHAADAPPHVWELIDYNQDGQPVAWCHLDGRRANCH